MSKKISRVDHSKMKSGRLPVKHDPRTFKLSTYLRGKHLTDTPTEWNWGGKVKSNKWGMMRNNVLDICTCAAAGHFIMLWTSNTGKLIEPRVISIIETYSAITGFDSKTGKNDTGAYLIDVLKYWRKYFIGGHRIFAFAQLENKNRELLKQAIYLFGGCYAGLALPTSAKTQLIWSVPKEGTKGNGAPGSWTDHCVLIIGYNQDGLRIITWGAEKVMTWDFWEAYCEESYAVFSDDFLKKSKNPAGINLKGLRRDIEALKKER
ncbi:MAG TPA: hypothetical protein VKR32_04800 [Puia sp.]|nr:hypothetical protein [Puia sp.]